MPALDTLWKAREQTDEPWLWVLESKGGKPGMVAAAFNPPSGRERQGNLSSPSSYRVTSRRAKDTDRLSKTEEE